MERQHFFFTNTKKNHSIEIRNTSYLNEKRWRRGGGAGHCWTNPVSWTVDRSNPALIDSKPPANPLRVNSGSFIPLGLRQEREGGDIELYPPSRSLTRPAGNSENAARRYQRELWRPARFLFAVQFAGLLFLQTAGVTQTSYSAGHLVVIDSNSEVGGF